MLLVGLLAGLRVNLYERIDFNMVQLEDIEFRLLVLLEWLLSDIIVTINVSVP